MSMVYLWKEGSRLHGDAQEVGRMLESLHEERGSISADDVLEAAKPKDSVLHDYFEWDNSEAAHQYRLVQAREIIRSIVVKIEKSPDENITTRAFVSLKQPLAEDKEPVGAYMPLSVVVQDTDLRRQLIRQALHEIDIFQRKYAALEEIVGLMAQLRQTLEAVV